MHIKEIYLENFRGFKELNIKFPPKLAVFIGINGSGKSTVLNAIAILLTQFVYLLFQKSFGSYPEKLRLLNEDDINLNYQKTRIFIKVIVEEDLELSWEIRRSRGIHNKADRKELINYTEKIVDQLKEGSQRNLPLIVYYQTRRMFFKVNFLENRETYKSYLSDPRNRIANQLYAYREALTSKLNDFQDFFDWFKGEEDYENEIRLREDANYRNPNLEIIRAAITRFLNNFPNTEFSNLRVVRSSASREFINPARLPSLTIAKNGQDFKLEQLSDGEKMLLMLVTDLARRLAVLNPVVSEPSQALDGQGIVLIDEVDLHLHPQWQRIVVSSLTKTFPNCQFIVTTHSAQVLSQVPKENVFVLEDAQLLETPHTFGRDNNSILYELMGVEERPIEIKEQLNKCFQLIDDEKIEQAKFELKKLADLLGTDDPEIVRAYTLIDFFDRLE